MKYRRPFPFPLNIGTDICQISRIYSILRSPRGARFVNRILTPEERARDDRRLRCLETIKNNNNNNTATRSGDLETRQDAQPSVAHRDPEIWKAATFIAGRFAVKEAAIKTHSHRRLTFHDIVIERRGRNEERLGSGPPVARIKGEEDVSAMVSISHDGDYATAVCMAYDPSVTGTRTTEWQDDDEG